MLFRSATEILIKDIGTAVTAPSEVQSIAIERDETVAPPQDEPSAPSDPAETPDQNKKPTIGAGAIAAIVIGSVIVAGAVAFAAYYFGKKKSRIK